MKLKKFISAAVTLAMTVTGIFGTNLTFAENEEISNNTEISLEADTLPPYKDTSLSFEERAADMVSRMTLDQKAAQLGYNAPEIKELGLGKYRYWREALHGVGRQGKATSFPSSLAMSNTWDTDLIRKAADITSTEARAKTGTKDNRSDLVYWSPTINMARDPRWGRNEESYGEDPFLTAQYGKEFVNGMQGNDQKYLKTVATLKHFVANNCEGERRTGSSVMDEQTLRDYYTRAFQDITEQANPGSVMSSYNATTITRNGSILYDYMPSTANSHTLNDLLRRTWGFSGFVVGDCGAVNLLNSTKAYKRTLFPDAEDLDSIPQSATIPFAIRGGNDMDCNSGGNAIPAHSAEAVRNGNMLEDEMDLAVYRAILMRMKTGEFDESDPYQNLKANSSLLETAENIAVAEEAAEKSWVLLKNADNTLPINSSVKKIALVGGLAGEAYLGGYSGEPENNVSPYQGLLNIVKEKNMDTEIQYLGNVADSTALFNIKSLAFLDSKGNVKTTVDLSKAEVENCTVSGSAVNDVTIKSSIVVKNVNFSGVASVRAEIDNVNTAIPGGNIVINYGSANQPVSYIPFESTSTSVSGEYTGATGGYTGTADLYIGIGVNSDFSVDKYKTQLDEADIILAYGGTTLSDSDESHDRKSIALPDSQSHVKAIADAYPAKTVVIMQTAGQIDISPFENGAKAILWNCYNGQTQGTALAKILFGDVNPSGKLSTTWYNPDDLNGKLNLNGVKTKTEGNIEWIRNDYSIRQRTTRPAAFPAEFSDEFIGRTYQYYKGNPVYPFGYGLSYTNFEYSTPTAPGSVDVNDKLTVSVNVKNTGAVSGQEVVQLYVKSPNGDGINLPLKQLKGFKRVNLDPGANKDVEIELDIKDLHFYDEAATSTYVPTGEYTIMVGGDSKSAENNTVKVNVTGTLRNELKTVSVIPTGISLIGTVYPDGKAAQAVKTVDPKLSAAMTNETFADLENAQISYTSSNEEVAYVEDGVVKANTKEGTALITASVTIDGVTKSVSFPVVSTLKNAITDEQRAEYKKSLDDLYKSYNQAQYSSENWALITNTYNDTLEQIETEFDNDVLKAAVDTALAKMKSIKIKPADGTELYQITGFTDTLYNDVEMEVKNNTDAYEPEATIIASVFDTAGKLVKSSHVDIGDSGKYTMPGPFNDGETLVAYVWSSLDKMIPLSNKYEHTYTAQQLPSYVVYNFTDSKFDKYYDSAANQELPSIEGLNGYGAFGTRNSKVSYTHTKLDGTSDTLNFTRALYVQGKGGTNERCVYFTPFPGYSSCKVTAIVDVINANRIMCIMQDGKNIAEFTGETGIKAFSAEITDMSKPVYITSPAGANKNLYAVIVEYTK